MPVFTPLINNFTSGELTESLDARTDLKRYYSGCRTLENFLISQFGGAIRRPGTYYVAETKDSSKESRLLPFEYNIEQSYALEFGDEYIRFYRNGGQIQSGNGIEDLSAFDNIIGHWLLNDDLATQDVLDDEENHNGSTDTNNTEDLHNDGRIGSGCFDLAGIDAIVINDHDDFSFDDTDEGTPSNNDPLSIVSWVYVTPSASEQVIMSKWKAGTAREWKFSLDSDRKLAFHLFDDSVSLSTSLVSHYKLNETSGTTITDAAGTQDGLSSTDASNLTETGKINTCFDLDGQYNVKVVDNDAYTFLDQDDTTPSNNDPLSISVWGYYEITGNVQQLITKWHSTNGREWLFYIDNNSKLNFSTFDHSATKQVIRTSDDAITEGWHLFTITYDCTDASFTHATSGNFITLYVDAVEIDSTVTKQEVGYDGMENGTSDVYIGTTSSLINYWANKLDNVMIFDKVLSSTEILLLYNNGAGTEDVEGSHPYCISDDALSVGWHMVSAVYDCDNASYDFDTAADYITLYVDDDVVDFTAYNSTDYEGMEAGATNVLIGAQYDSSGNIDMVWADKIDSTAIFSDKLTANEISTLYNESAYEITSPYGESDLFELKTVQSADVLYIVHSEYAPRKLSRYGHDNWTLEAIDFTWGAFMDLNTTAVTITPSATTGDNITLTASSGVFNSDHIGSLWSLAHPRTDNSQNGDVPAAEAGTTAITLKNTCRFRTVAEGADTEYYEIQRKYDSDPDYHTFKSLRGGINYDLSWEELDKDGASYRIYCTAGSGTKPKYTLSCEHHYEVGYAKITGIVSSTVANAEVIEDFGATDATKLWSEGAWSDYRGWPRAIGFFENRVVYGGNEYNPLTLWFTETNSFESMRGKTLAENENYDDDALIFTISAGQQNTIQWVLGQEYLLVGNAGAEGKLSSYNRNQALTPSNIPEYRPQSSYGSGTIQPILINDVVVFVERDEKKVREFKYDFDTDIFVSKDLTKYSRHITESGIKQMAYQTQPESILWAINEDGELLAMTYERLEEIYGWSRMVTDGDFESVAVISSAGQSTSEDEIWVIVNRTIGGSTKRYVEYFKPRNWGSDDTDVFFVDSGLTATDDESAFSSVSGLSHLEGETVDILADGKYCDQQTVSSGAVDLKIDGSAITADKAHVGLNYESTLEPMPLEIPIGELGSSRGRMKRIHEAVISFENTLGGFYGRDASNLDELDHSVEGTSGSMTALKTVEESVSWPGLDETEGDIMVKQTYPLPMTVRAIIPKLDIGET